MPSLVGKTLGQYHIIEEIGRGMAIVYRAYQPSLERYVAIKVLPPQLALDTTFVQRFLREARTAARLEHSNIVTIHDVGQQGDFYYFVMQELKGEPLNRLIQREGPLPLERVTSIVAQVASALDYAHAQGVVHRDIKPSNIIIGPNDHATLTDFGIAKAAMGTRLTRTGLVVGTPEYMSPEQAKGEEVGPATDIYSLGVVTYEMLAGRVPFEAENTAAILHKHAYERPQPVRAHAPHLPEGVDGVLAKALAKEPTRRFRSAGELAGALREAVKGKPFHYAEPEPPTIFAPPIGKKWKSWVVPVLGGLLILMMAGLAATGLLRSWGHTPIPSATSMVMISETASPSPKIATTSAPEPPIPIPTPSATPTPYAGKPQIVTRHAINVYSGPGNSYAKAGQTAEGQELDIIGTNPEGTWWRVCCVGGEAVWIEADLVEVQGSTDGVPIVIITSPTPTPTRTPTLTPTPTRTPAPTPTPTRTPTPKPVAIVQEDKTNVRKGPGTSYDIVGQVWAGETLDIVAKNSAGTWWQVCCVYGKRVWIKANLVKTKGLTSAVSVARSIPPPPTPTPTPIRLGYRCFEARRRHWEKSPIGAGEIRGIVYDRNGRPFSGATVHLYIAHSNWETHIALAPDGVYTFCCLGFSLQNLHVVELVGDGIKTVRDYQFYMNDVNRNRVLVDFYEVSCP